MNRQMTVEPKDEYRSSVIVWSSYKGWLRTFQPGTRQYEDAMSALPDLERRMSELRKQLGITPEMDDAMIAAIESIIDDGKTIQSFLDIMLNDPFYSNIRFNVMSQTAEYPDAEGKPHKWTDADEAASQAYIEKAYHMYQAQKHTAALRLLFKAREYNPIVDFVETIKWDGKERCERFLIEWGNVDDTPYCREVSRLIFAGGIHRLYNPGCKFDDVPILIGTKQGEGKSSIIRFLAIKDEWFGEINQFEGQPSIEQLSGKWICEIPELSALTKTKDVEASKAFITRAVDSYRKPYDRNTIDLPRRCIFLGTTNNATPLRDTYNRRYYPVTMHTSGYDLFQRENECREYIIQCWAEAREKYKAHDKAMQPFAKRELLEQYREQQENARQDDWRIGAIESYLDTKSPGEFVCIRELTNKALALQGVGHDPTIVESKDLGMIMALFDDWVKTGRRYFAEYGQQRAWQKASVLKEVKDDTDELPF